MNETLINEIATLAVLVFTFTFPLFFAIQDELRYRREHRNNNKH